MVSYGFGRFFNSFIFSAFSSFGFFFYESEIQLAIWLTTLGYVIFSVWNAINNPLVGYLTDKPYKFTKKWGRRFPWILVGAIPWAISYLLIFIPPVGQAQQNSLLIFAWLVFATICYDGFASLWEVNYFGLFPDKFRNTRERRNASGIALAIGALGTALGSILPWSFVVFGELDTYVTQALIVMFVALIAFLISIPGSRDDPEKVEKYLNQYEIDDKESFVSSLKKSMKQRNFVWYVLAFFCFEVVNLSLIASLPYYLRYVLLMEAEEMTVIMLFFLIGSVFAIPIWLKLGHSFNDNKKTMIFACLTLAIVLFPLILIQQYVLFLVFVFLIGITNGGISILIDPVFGDVIDEATIKIGMRREATYKGIQQFFFKFAIIVQALSFGIIHTVTGFDPGTEIQNPLAIFGILAHLALIPMIFTILMALIFWKLYGLSRDRVEANKRKLEELKI